jgi:4-alpha-glucanotransferase
MNIRGSGVLLHITSLPSPYGIGDLGPPAYQFVDFLVKSRQSFWQILPLTPIDPICGNSPYSSNSAFAGNIFLISPQLLIEDELLSENDCDCDFSEDICNYEDAIAFKRNILNLAFEAFNNKKKDKLIFNDFCSRNAWWLDDYVIFVVIKKCLHKQAWSDWPKELANREEKSLRKIENDYAEEIMREKFFQYLLYKQWNFLKNYCSTHNIKIIGDIPIYVSYDSADVWAHSDIFKLKEDKKPSFLAGVPPDYFSKTGQLWGNPVYNWDKLKETNYAWWFKRIDHNLSLFDIIRVDHFRGFVASWEVKADEKTAINGQWKEAPVQDFFTALYRQYFNLPIVAEDLGIITADVREILYHFEIPGMKVLLFAFGEDNPMHPYLPHTYEKNYIAYTGTHDTNTIRGWFENETTEQDRKRLTRYIGNDVTVDSINWELIRLLMRSVADIVIIPMQDLLGLGEEARMNRPSVAAGNWLWRLQTQQLSNELIEKLSAMTQTYGR